MIKQPNRLWIVVLLLGWAFDFLFWGKSVGINLAIFITICLLGGFFLLLANGLRPASKSLWLIIPFVFFAVITFVRQEPLTLFLAYTFTFVSMGLLTVTYLGGRWTQYSLLDYFKKFFQLIGSMIARPKNFYNKDYKEKAELRKTIKGLPIKPVLRGLLIALPIVVYFAYLLASADLVFNQKLIAFIGLFNLGRIIGNRSVG